MGRPRLYPDIQTQWREIKRRNRKARQSQLRVYHRSVSQEWETPQPVFDAIHVEFGFTLDVAAMPNNAKCPRYFTKDDDALLQCWGTERCWMNPPFGRTIDAWIRKAFESSQAGALVVCLLPARTDTRWWHAYIQDKAEIRYFPRRLKYGGAKHNAPFPSALVIFYPYGGSSYAQDSTKETPESKARDSKTTLLEPSVRP